MNYSQSLALLKRLAYLHGKHIYDDYHVDPNIKIVKEGLVNEGDMFVYYHDRPMPLNPSDATCLTVEQESEWLKRTGLNPTFYINEILASVRRGKKAAIAELKRRARSSSSNAK